MSLIAARLKHHAKVFVGARLESFLHKRYLSGQGPASRLISVFSDEIKRMGVEPNMLVDPVSVKKLIPDFTLDGDIETEYRTRLLAGEGLSSRAGIFSAQNVDVSFPTGMHQIGDHIFKECMLSPYVLTNPKYYYAVESMRFKRKRRLSEGILLSMPWHHNFYHWMIEILPRLISFDRFAPLQHVPLIVPKSAPTFVAESLRLAGYQSNTLFLEDGIYSFKTMHMLSTLAPTTEVSSDAVDWLNNKLINVSSTRTPPKKIYVSRRDAKIRFVSNEVELSDVLAEYGFETLVMSELSLRDQINIFRNAECIIGPHGAAFSNLVFSKPGSIFIEFFRRGHYSPSFNRIAGIRRLKYGFLVGEPTRLGGLSVNPNNLRAVLAQTLQSPTWQY